MPITNHNSPVIPASVTKRRAIWQYLMIGRRDMGMSARDERNAAIDEIARKPAVARCLGMENRQPKLSQPTPKGRTAGYFARDRRESDHPSHP